MPLFSEAISKKSPAVQRHLHSKFQRAVRNGEIEALQLLTKFQVPKVRDGYKEVFDYAYTSATQITVGAWITANEQLPQRGTTAEQIADMSDEQLAALIKQQQQSTKKPAKRAKPKPKATPKTKAKAPRRAKAKPKTAEPSKEQQDAPKAPEKEATKTTNTSTGPLSESTMNELRKRATETATADQREGGPSKKEAE